MNDESILLSFFGDSLNLFSLFKILEMNIEIFYFRHSLHAIQSRDIPLYKLGGIELRTHVNFLRCYLTQYGEIPPSLSMYKLFPSRSPPQKYK